MDYLTFFGFLGMLFMAFIAGRVIGKREGYGMGWRAGYVECVELIAQPSPEAQKGQP